MKKVAEYIEDGYLGGDLNVKVDVFVDGSKVVHAAQSKLVYKVFEPGMRTFPLWTSYEGRMLKAVLDEKN